MGSYPVRFIYTSWRRLASRTHSTNFHSKSVQIDLGLSICCAITYTSPDLPEAFITCAFAYFSPSWQYRPIWLTGGAFERSRLYLQLRMLSNLGEGWGGGSHQSSWSGFASVKSLLVERPLLPLCFRNLAPKLQYLGPRCLWALIGRVMSGRHHRRRSLQLPSENHACWASFLSFCSGLFHQVRITVRLNDFLRTIAASSNPFAGWRWPCSWTQPWDSCLMCEGFFGEVCSGRDLRRPYASLALDSMNYLHHVVWAISYWYSHR